MDKRTSAVEEIVKNGSDIISGYIYFRGKYSDVSKAVKLSRSLLNKYMAKNAYHSIELGKHARGAIRKNTQYRIDNYGKHNRAKTRCQSA